MTPETKLGRAVAMLSEAFAEAGLDTPDLDARFLALHALNLRDADFYAARDKPLGSACAALEAAARRRLAREPVARIFGEWEFWSLPFRLNAATLVPRPDTETVVEAALTAIDDAGRRAAPLRILDIGTGSGAILIALLHELPRAFGIGTDLSAQAVRAARANARRNGVADRAAFLAGHWTDALAGRFDLVVSNPPYVAHAAIAGLEPEVRDHDPALALDGGADGLDAYRALAARLPGLLDALGVAVIELGAGQAPQVTETMLRAGSGRTRTRRDLAGVERALIVTVGGA